jgi:hypothetical protein
MHFIADPASAKGHLAWMMGVNSPAAKRPITRRRMFPACAGSSSFKASILRMA